MAQWILTIGQMIVTAIMVATVLYNTVVTHAILKNDVKHLAESVKRIEQWIFDKAKK